MRHRSLIPLLSLLTTLGTAACGGGAFSEQGSVDGGTGDDASLDGSGPGEGSPEASVDAGEMGVGVIGEACTPPNALSCAGHAQKLVLYCDPVTGRWSALQSCAGQQLCDTRPGTTQGSCQDPVALCVGLEPGAALCDGSSLVECGPDLVTEQRTDCPQECMDGACVGVCKPGDTRCSETIPQTCDPGGTWRNGAPCAFLCSLGACTGLCTPGDVRCDGDVPQTCDAEGQWQSGAPCANVCSSGVCEDACTEGTTQCSGVVSQTCQAGLWEDGSQCSFVCTSGACAGECVPSSMQCEGSIPNTCDATGHWQSGAPCPFVCVAGSCTGVCQPGDKKCSGLVPQVCNAGGQWESGPACTYVCNAGGCGGVCAPGAKQCSGSTPQTCNAEGVWESGAPCQNVCTAGTCTGSCTPGSKQCNGNVPQTCSASGQWVNGTICSNICASGACTGECSPGAKRCSGTLTQTCDASGLWVDGSTCAYVCQSGACGGVCVPGATRCEGGGVQTCQSTGQWGTAVSCSAGTSCQAGHCAGSSAVPPSCTGSAAGCGLGGASSCCETIQVPGGSFNRSNDPIFPATVSALALDVYEVTVRRFRAFINAGKGTKANAPAAGAGAHPAIAASGWQTAWNTELVNDSEDLENALDCDNTYATFTNSSDDTLPINCATWYEMFAFCAWDGGRLPTEAEWNFVAAGGAEQRTYPWASGLIDPSYAVYDCTGDGSVSQQCAFPDILRVGSKSSKGDGRWGHADLAGSMSEAVLDMWSSPYASILCTDCANLLPSSSRVIRGGAFLSPASVLYSSWRSASSPSARSAAVGFRCARSQ